MLASLVFDLPHASEESARTSLWLRVGALLVVGYIVFALVLIGIPGLSRGGIAMAVLAFGWLLFGIATGPATFPRVLLLPLAFYAWTLASGFMLDRYPVDYVGQLTTVWIGGIAIAAFVANGVSLNLVIGGFVLLFAANMVAVAVGYDGYQVNVVNEGLSSSLDGGAGVGAEIARVSGLAGQTNLLVGLAFTLPFLLFLTRRAVGLVVYLLALAVCITITIQTGSRSGIAFTLLFVVAGALFMVRSLPMRAVMVALGLAGSMFIYVYFEDPLALSRLTQGPLGDLVIVKRTLAGIDGTDNSAAVREQLASGFWDQFNARPFFGYGPNQFSVVSGDGLYAHNNFAEIAVNWGLVGLLLYYAMYVVAFVGCLFSVPPRLPALATLAFLVAADIWFVTFIERPLVLCLCLLLVVAAGRASVRGSGRRSRSRSRSGRRRRRRPA